MKLKLLLRKIICNLLLGDNWGTARNGIQYHEFFLKQPLWMGLSEPENIYSFVPRAKMNGIVGFHA